MASKSELIFCAVKFQVIIALCVLNATANALDPGTVAPLIIDQPVSSEKFGGDQNHKKIETRFHDPQPEYYK